ncbi:MAG TPA: hypothetical protein VFA20_25645 [Myxococcaceae bacterium]|nr:hypothetical protein [Myxococcaceae bacterium]
MTRALVTGALLCVLWPASALAGPPDHRAAPDGGRAAPQSQTTAPTTSDEDREVIENLDLLQAMEGAKDLDLLLELNKDRDGDGE